METEAREPIVITRGTIGQWASFAGGVGLLLGILGWVWSGELAGIVLLPWIVGIAGLVLWAFMTPREFVGFFTGRQVRYGTVAVFSTLLLGGIVSMAYIVLEREVLTLDMTESGSFTLSQETQRVLDEVNQEIRITGFYSPSLAQQREIDDQFFRLYTVASDGLITREYIDPVENPALAESFGARDGDVFISFVTADGSVDMSTLYIVPLTGTQERDMTEAISRLLAAGDFVVYFDRGLGELDPLDGSQRGLSAANNLLQNLGYFTIPLNIEEIAANEGTIPADADALILARPTSEPSAGAIAVIDAYLRNGGSLFIMADTQTDFMTEGSPFNQYMWDNWGLRLLEAVAVDDMVSGATTLDIISAAVSTSEITTSINPDLDPTTATQFHIARVIEVDETPPVANGHIIRTSPGSYAETNLSALFQRNEYAFDEGDDFVGPVTTVAFAEDDENTGARILLVGDADFITNGQITSPLGNVYLFRDGLGWLTRFNEEVGFAPQARITGLPLLFVTNQQLDSIAFMTVVLIPGIVLAAGVFVWWRRTRR